MIVSGVLRGAVFRTRGSRRIDHVRVGPARAYHSRMYDEEHDDRRSPGAHLSIERASMTHALRCSFTATSSISARLAIILSIYPSVYSTYACMYSIYPPLVPPPPRQQYCTVPVCRDSRRARAHLCVCVRASEAPLPLPLPLPSSMSRPGSAQCARAYCIADRHSSQPGPQHHHGFIA